MTRTTRAASPVSNILSGAAATRTGETVETLLKGDGIRVERIISYGQVSPAGLWYDQDEAEWVVLLSGGARLTIEGETEDRELGPGDSLLLPAHCRHRVAWTTPDQATIWLAIFVDARLKPGAGG